VCIKKQLLVTASSDRTVRIWDYDRKSLELCESFKEEAYGVAFHPTGLHIVVGFADKLRFMNVIEKKLVSYKEIPLKSCKEIHFCNGGHLVAVASGNVVHAFNFYTGECPSNFIFKGQETNITSLYWMADDMGFFSSNWNGMIDKCILNTGACEIVYSLKGTKITSVLEVIEKDKTLFAATSDRQIRSFKNRALTAIIDAGTTLGNLVITKTQEYLIAGIEEKQRPGSLRVYKYPLNGDFVEVEAHSAEVKKIRISYNNRYLFSVGEDGTLFMFEIRRSAKAEDIRIVYSNDILYSRRELENKVKEIERLAEENREKAEENERIFNEEKKLKLKEIEEKQIILDEQTKILDDFIKSFEEEMESTIKLHDEKMQVLIEEFKNRRQEEEAQYEEKMKEEDMRILELEKEIKSQKDGHTKMMEDAKRKHKTMLQELEAKYAEKLENIRKEDADLTEKIANSEKEYETKREALEADTWKSLDKESIANNNEMLCIIKDKYKAKQELLEIVKRKEAKEKEVKNLMSEKKLREEELKGNQNTIQVLKIEKQAIEKDIEDRDETIRQKKLRVEELRKREQELEKFKFVLDYKMRELRGEMEPKQQEIEKLHEQEFKMDEEVRHFTKANQNMHLIIYDLLGRQQGMTTELEKQKAQEEEDNQFRAQFSEDIADVCKCIDNPRQLKEKVVEYHKKYLNEKKKKTEAKEDNQEVHAIRRKHFEEKIHALNGKKVTEGKNHATDNTKLINENERLLVQYNELQKRLHIQNLMENERTRRTGGSDIKKKEISLQNAAIEKLSREMEMLERENERLKAAKPQVLPPLQPEHKEDLI
jgi:hypothetical protein